LKPWPRAKMELHIAQRIRERCDIAIRPQPGPDGEIVYCLRPHGETMLWSVVQEALRDAGWYVEECSPKARPLDEWHEDFGEVLWWVFPMTEPPYIGSPLCNDWPGYHTHWTPCPPVPAFAEPVEPKG
jgi:hypothetical protein